MKTEDPRRATIFQRLLLAAVAPDGCHPNRVRQGLVADALADAVRSTFGR